MKAILVLALCFCCSISYKLFKGNTIPKDYAIGMLKYIEFIGSDRIFFTTQEDVIGLMDAKTGGLILVYELEDDERIIQHRGSRFIVVQKNRDLNLLLPKNQSYFKLQYSKFLQKQTFKQILSFKRFFKHDYILTDQFLAKAQNPYSLISPANQTQKQEDKFEIIEKRTDPNQKYLKLMNLADKYPTMVLVSLKQINNSNSICIIRYLIEEQKPQKVCAVIDPNLKVMNVMQMGPNIQVQTDKNNIYFNSKLQIVRQIKNQEMFAFFDQMNRATDPNYRKEQHRIKAISRIAMNFANPSNYKNIDIYQRYILVKKQNSVIVVIPKTATDRPIDYWTYTTDFNSVNFGLIVQFQDGKVACFEIDQKAKTYKQLWTLHINAAKKDAQGQQRQAKEVNLETEQELLEKVGKANDIEINSNSKNSQP